MASKKIALGSNLRFESISEGKAYFEKILKNTPLDQYVAAGEFDDLKLLYEEYCAKTNWPMLSSPKAFFPTHEQQKGYTTTCFGVEFQDGRKDRFSLDKALSEVAS